MKSTVSSIRIPKWTCNNAEYTIFDFSRFTQVESIEIGNDCFRSVKTFKIDGLNRLKSLAIGENSFTQHKNDWGNDKSKSFHILNCESLESIQIGQYSFSDFAGDFELKNLPKLQSIQIVKYQLLFRYNYQELLRKIRLEQNPFEALVYSFCFSSFMIEGIDIILV